MKPEDLKVGHLYRLRQAVENPIVDRRSANPMLKLPAFHAGTYFVCLNGDDFENLIQLKHGSYSGVDGAFTVGVHEEDGTIRPSKYDRNTKWADAVMPWLEEVPVKSWDHITRTFGTRSMSAALRELWEDGTITLERLLELMRKHTIGAGPV